MKKKTTELLWCICLAILGIATIIICISSLSDYKLNPIIIRALGISEIAVMPFAIFLTVQIVKKNK